MHFATLNNNIIIKSIQKFCFIDSLPCFAQVPVAGEDNEPDAEEGQHHEGGEEGDEEAGDQGALHMGHTLHGQL